MALTLQDIGQTRVITLKHSDSIDKALALMEEHDIHHLPVVKGTRPIGMISDRDLLLSVGWMPLRERSIEEGPAGYAGPTVVSQILHKPVKVVQTSARPEQGIRIMLEHSIHALPLISGEHLAGIITKLDFLKLYADERLDFSCRPGWAAQRVRDHMRAWVISMRSTETLAAGIRLMREKQIRHLPIVDDHKLIGIVSDRDLRRTVGRSAINATRAGEPWSEARYRITLGEVMSKNVVTVGPTTTLSEAAMHMTLLRIGTLPMMANDEMVGIITDTDLLRALSFALRT